MAIKCFAGVFNGCKLVNGGVWKSDVFRVGSS